MRTSYSERLSAPVSWWLIGLFFSVTFVSAVGLYAGPSVSLAASLITAVVVAVALLALGSARVRVTSDGLHAGAASLAWDAVGEVIARDAAATAARLGPQADPRGWLLVRGYVPTSVEIVLTDLDDPHPYWLVSTRHPDALAAAIEAARPAVEGGS